MQQSAERTLARYSLLRTAQAVPLVIGAVLLTFVLIHVAPGDPIVALAGEDGDPGYYAMMRERFGLDKPVWHRLLIYIGAVASGDLGFSYRNSAPAVDVILDHLPATLLLLLPAIVIASIVGVGLALLAASKPHSKIDRLVSSLALSGHVVPVFWSAQLLLLLFAVQLGLFPVQGMSDVRANPQGWAAVVDVGRHMVLPVTALVIQFMAPIARVCRAQLIEEMKEPYVLAARARGASESRILRVHALRNALLAVITVIGAQFGFMLSGAVLTETVFAWPGLGRLLLTSMLARDYAIITTLFLLIAIAIVVSNLVVDLVYAFIDPRVRHV